MAMGLVISHCRIGIPAGIKAFGRGAPQQVSTSVDSSGTHLALLIPAIPYWEKNWRKNHVTSSINAALKLWLPIGRD